MTRRGWLAVILALAVIVPVGHSAQTSRAEVRPDVVGPGVVDLASVDALARGLHYEGLRYEDAAGLRSEEITRLLSLLADPAESAHYANIVMVLGMNGGDGVASALLALASEEPVGEVDGATYRLRVALPIALGHLARNDDDALAFLIEQVRERPDELAWSAGPYRGRRLTALMRRGAIRGLAISGRPEAERLLLQLQRRLRASSSEDPKLERTLQHAREIRRRVAEYGPALAFRNRPDARGDAKTGPR